MSPCVHSLKASSHTSSTLGLACEIKECPLAKKIAASIPFSPYQIITPEVPIEKCAELIERNAKILNINPSYSQQGTPSYGIREEDAFSAIKKLAREGRIFDIIFLDPPYGVELAKKALKTLGAYGIVHPVSIVVIQHDKRERLPSENGKLKVIQEKQYGNTMLSIYNCQ